MLLYVLGQNPAGIDSAVGRQMRQRAESGRGRPELRCGWRHRCDGGRGAQRLVWDAAAGRDPRREALDIEAAIGDTPARNTQLRHHQIMVYGRA
jgi:hypothetical protein